MTALNGMTATSSLASSGTINITTGMSGNVKVFNTTGFSQSGAITFGCGGSTSTCSNAIVVIKASSSLSLNNNILLADGLTSDQVIFYSNANTVTVAAGTSTAITANASFFVTGAAANFGGTVASSKATNVFGRIYDANGDITFNSVGGGTQDDLGPLPEPGTWALMALMASGMGAILWGGGRRKKKASRRDGQNVGA